MQKTNCVYEGTCVLKVKVISLPFYFPAFVCFVLYQAKISGERFHDHWSSGSPCSSLKFCL